MNRPVLSAARLLCLLGVMWTLGSGVAVADPTAAKLDGATRTIVDALSSLKGVTQAEAELTLGKPLERTFWMFHEKQEPQLVYQSLAGWKLGVYFYGGRVIKTSFQVLR
ncbi:MAG: hypothetical protein ABI321_24795 [Polyangia bacterium]